MSGDNSRQKKDRTPLRILFIAPAMPAETGNGLAMRAGQFLDGLSRQFEVDLAVILVAGADSAANAFVSERIRKCRVFTALHSDSHFALIDRLTDPEERLAAFDEYGRPSVTSVMTPALREDFENWCAGIDYAAVHIMRLYLAPLAQIWLDQEPAARPVLTLDCDEDEAGTHRSLARCQHRMGRAWRARWLDAEARAFRRFAEVWYDKFDSVFFSSPVDARAHAFSRHVPNTSTVPRATRRAPTGRIRNILFLGTLSYAPNTEAVLWFVRRVWPLLTKGTDQPIKCWFTGPKPTEAMRKFARRDAFRVTGPVQDVADSYARADLVVVPILSGGGTRIKVIEAAAHGVPVIATPFGASGLSLRHGRDLLIAKNAQSFAHACLRLIGDPKLAGALAARARYQVVRHYDRRVWVDRIGSMMSDLVLNKGRHRRYLVSSSVEDVKSNIM